MKSLLLKSSILTLFICSLLACAADEPKWHVLFDGQSLEGWRDNAETPNVFTVLDDGSLQVSGGRAHLFWIGTLDIPSEFVDFELSLKVKTTANANSGVFFHTRFQETGWPEQGLEAQVNTSHKDRRKTGSIWNKSDVLDEAPSTDGKWFDYLIRVQGKKVTVSVDGQVVNEYIEPENPEVDKERPLIRLGKGTFALQGHDPKSTVFYKQIKVRSL